MSSTKGIILLGGSGSRLWPTTKGVSKQLLGIYDKPMCYYSLSTLMLAEIKDVFIISDPQNIDLYKRLLGTGEKWGMKFSYCVQERPMGIAQAFLLGEYFIGGDDCCLMLGDNLFHGSYFTSFVKGMRNKLKKMRGAVISAAQVSDPSRYGIIEFDATGKAISLEEKPQNPKSDYAIPGLYFYDNRVVEIAKRLKPSARGEYEITDVNRKYLADGSLQVCPVPRGFTWLDTGTTDSLLESSSFVQTVQKRQNVYIGCPEEIAFRNGWIDEKELHNLALEYRNNDYGNYLIKLIEDKAFERKPKLTLIEDSKNG